MISQPTILRIRASGHPTPFNLLRSTITSSSNSTSALTATSRCYSSRHTPISTRITSTQSRPFALSQPQPTHHSQTRPSSTSSLPSSSSPPPTTTISNPASPPPGNTLLTWNDFFRLRKVRRYYNLISSLGLSLSSLGIGMAILSQQNLNTLQQYLFGVDPMIVIGGWSLGFFGLGWLLGPAVGGAVWGAVHRRAKGIMESKESNFFSRIRKYRVDPSSSSMQNPVPDYYGEKITSVAGYRSWLKDQRAFNRKRTVSGSVEGN